MALMTRMARLFRADLHALLDRIEDPPSVLAQSLREMDDALRDTERRLVADRQQRDTLLRRQREIGETLAGIGPELELCLDAGNDALARLLLRRRLEGERMLAQLQRGSARLDESIGRSSRELDEQREAFERIRQQTAASVPTAPVAAPGWSAEQCVVSDADVELALLRERSRRS